MSRLPPLCRRPRSPPRLSNFSRAQIPCPAMPARSGASPQPPSANAAKCCARVSSRSAVTRWRCSPQPASTRPNAPRIFRSRALLHSRASSRSATHPLQLRLQGAHEGREPGLALALEPLGGKDRTHLGKGALDVAIDHHVVVLGPVAHL